MAKALEDYECFELDYRDAVDHERAEDAEKELRAAEGGHEASEEMKEESADADVATTPVQLAAMPVDLDEEAELEPGDAATSPVRPTRGVRQRDDEPEEVAAGQPHFSTSTQYGKRGPKGSKQDTRWCCKLRT